jgi:hypothetical protein
MPHFNILIACDQKYYDDWGKTLLETTFLRNSWLAGSLHCHIVNPDENDRLPYVNYSFETREFASEESRISYLQSARFLAVADKISNEDFFITLDADTICTRDFDECEFQEIFDNINVLKHRKAGHWLAGFVTFNSVKFAKDYASELLSKPIEEWQIGRDQIILDQLSKRYDFKELSHVWMSYGKSIRESAFFTLKGNQKTSDKYLYLYEKFLL